MAKQGARVVTIEADPLAADRIRRAGLVHGSGRIELIEAALSDKPGEVTFAGLGRSVVGSGKIIADGSAEVVESFLAEISRLNVLPLSLLNHERKERHRFVADEVDVRQVPAVTLDGLCAELGLRDVAILKMDIEGGELLALRGGSRLIDGDFGTPPIVAFEYSALFPTRS